MRQFGYKQTIEVGAKKNTQKCPLSLAATTIKIKKLNQRVGYVEANFAKVCKM
jgi:hypothetical protein